MIAWDEVKLDEVTSLIKRGIAPKYVEIDGYPIINQKCIRDNTVSYEDSKLINKSQRVTKEKYLQDGDILVNSTGTGTLGRVAKYKNVGDNVFCDTHVTIVRANEKIDKDFLAYQLSYKEPMIENYGKGATNQIELASSDLGLLKIQFPPLPIQKKIAKILSNYDDLIENNLQRIKLLEELARLTYEKWMINYNTWKEYKLEDLADYLGRGVTPKYEEGTGFYGINQKANKGSLLDSEHFKEYKAGNWIPEAKYAWNGDVLINSLGEGTIGRVHFYNWESKKYPVDQHMTIFRANKEINIYVFHLLSSKLGQAFLHSIKKGGTNMTMLNISDIRKLKIKVPSEEELKLNTKSILNYYDFKTKLEFQNKLLKEARDILLPRLMTGMIDIEDMKVAV